MVRGLYYKIGPSGQPYDQGVGYAKNGDQWHGTSGFRDSNGNLYSATLDTLGRSLVTKTYDPAYDSANPLSRPQYEIYTVNNSNGVPEQYRIDFTNVHVVSNVCAQWGFLPGTPLATFPCQDVASDVNEIGKITLPSGRAYTFHYADNTPDDISEIDLPTGASITYEYGDFYQQREASGLSFPTVVGSRAVETRTVTVNGAAQPWHYALSVGQNVVTDPQQNVQNHLFGHVSSGTAYPAGYLSQGLYETDVSYADNQGHVLRSVHTDYAADDFVRDMTAINVRPIRVTTTLDNGLTSKVETDYDSFTFNCFLCGESVQGTRMNPKQIREYGFGNGSPGGLVRATSYSYLHEADSRYKDLNIVNRPIEITVSDGAGYPVKDTVYEYDDYLRSNPILVSGAIQHDSSFNTAFLQRGNVTAASQWINSSNSYVTEVYQYDDAGNRIARRDANGHQTNYDFSDQWHNSACAVSGQTKAYLSAVTNAKGQITATTNNSCTGTPGTVTDANTQTTTYTYGTMNRLTRTDYPDQGWFATCYSDDPNGGCARSGNLFSIQTQGGTQRATTASTDGLGRVTNVDITGGQQAIHTVYAYDGLGQLYSATSPFYTQQDPTYGTTSHHYDALGREVRTELPDDSYTRSSFSGNTVDSYDEAGAHWQRMYDLLGLRKVLELGTDASPLHLETDYDYDLIGNLTAVHQLGDGTTASVERQFTYDSLSRLITSANPETGTICYGQWSGGACTGGYNGNGNLLHKTNANGQTVDYSYDALNRLVSKSSVQDGETNFNYVYDQGSNGIGRLSSEYRPGVAGTGFEYDSMGRVTKTQWFNYAAASWQPGMEVQYDLAGNVIQLNYPDNQVVVSQDWDTAGRLSAVYAGPQGQGGAPYMSNPSYSPAGALTGYTSGNGVIGGMDFNSRLQPCHEWASLLPTGTSTASPMTGNLLDRTLAYAAVPETPCGTAAGNNGNIWHILEPTGSNGTPQQNFTYDSLNRLTSAVTSNRPAAASYSFNYNIDSFGNMLPSGPSVAIDYSLEPGGQNRIQTDGGLLYDANGNVKRTSIPGTGGGLGYTWTAEGFLRDIGVYGQDRYSVGSYLYNGSGERFFAAQNNRTWNEYVYLNGQPMADVDNTGAWTDYIYANGQKIAKVGGGDTRLHREATTCSSCGWQWTALYTAVSLHGRTIHKGDRLAVSQYAAAGTVAGVGLNTTLGEYGPALGMQDQDGSPSDQDGTTGMWHHRLIDLDALADRVIDFTYFMTPGNNGAGPWSVDYRDFAYIAADGTVTKIYSGESTAGWFEPATAGQAGLLDSALTGAPYPGGVQPTYYYLADHLGTTQMELAAGGWPVWQGYFSPYGKELLQKDILGAQNPDGTSMRFKFTGKERDAESGLDYFGARYYGSSMGRWMSPDWADKPEAVPYSDLENPQSLNLYGYVNNNPLSKADPDGHFPDPPTSTNVGDFAVGVLRGFVSSVTWGHIGAPSSSDSLSSLAGQGLGTAITGGSGTSMVSGSGPVAIGGLAAAIPTGGSSLVVSGGALVTGAVGAEMAGGAAKNALLLAKAYSAGANFSKGTANDAKNRAEGKCTKCGVETTPGVKSEKGVKRLPTEGTTDHRLAKSNGGTNDPTNADHMCLKCNRAKSNN